jgi:hypothetical protein
MKYFTIKDNKAEFFHQPFTARNINDAVRTVTTMVNNSDPNNMLASHPNDYSLFMVGDFDDNEGQLTADWAELGNLSQFKKETLQGV